MTTPRLHLSLPRALYDAHRVRFPDASYSALLAAVLETQLREAGEEVPERAPSRTTAATRARVASAARRRKDPLR